MTLGVTDGVPVSVPVSLAVGLVDEVSLGVWLGDAVSLGVWLVLAVSLGEGVGLEDDVGVNVGHVSTVAPISRTRPPSGFPVSVKYMAAASRYREVGPDTLAALKGPQSPTVSDVESVVKNATVPSDTVTLIR